MTTTHLLDLVRTVVRSARPTARIARVGGSVVLLATLAACPKGDVGAPCNHGKTQPPESKLVTFPALTCNELLCVYADSDEAPKIECTDAVMCNSADPGVDRFECVISEGMTSGRCQLKIEYVLERSMCSKKCSSDADCKDGGPTKKVVVENTKCQSGFTCARIQTLGEFCCDKLCVCRDDLDEATVMDIQNACAAGTQQGCCTGANVDVPGESCGRP
ncbi:MAG: hypothetical protein K1X88_06470 [Nannocystaceae bacterium]|nr:hypothetical protein [Nannocystaceae bacterium]